MEVQFTPDQQAGLARLAAEQGRSEESLVREAIDRLLSYNEWFVREVEKGLADADRKSAGAGPLAAAKDIATNGHLTEPVEESIYVLNVSPSRSAAGLQWRTCATPLTRKPFPSDVRTPLRGRG